MRNSFWLLWILIVTWEISAPGFAWARRDSNRVDRRTREQAEQLRDSGAEALAAKDLEAAKKALYLSYERHPASETLYYLGLLATAEGQPIAAQDLLRRFLREVGDA